MDKDKNPRFVVDFGNGQSIMEFDTIEELESWVRKERAQWKWLEEARPEGTLANFLNKSNGLWNQNEAQIHSLKNAEYASRRQGSEDTLKSTLKSFARLGARLRSDDPRAKFVSEIADQDSPTVAAHALVSLCTRESMGNLSVSAVLGLI